MDRRYNPSSRDEALIAEFAVSPSAATAHNRALDHLAERIVRALADGGSPVPVRALIDRVRARYAAVLAEGTDTERAIATSNKLVVEGMRLALNAAAVVWPLPVPRSGDELTGAFAPIDAALHAGDHITARARFGALALAALGSPEADPTLAYRVPRGCAFELRGWVIGLSLLLGARRRLAMR